MAPTLLTRSVALSHPLSLTMSSQTRLPSVLRNNPTFGPVAPHQSPPFQFGTTTKLHVGKHNVEIDILSMAPISGEQFMRSSCYEHLVSTLEDHRTTFTPTELTAALCTAIPINTTTAAETAHQLCQPIRTSPYNVNNLHFRGFRNHRGNEIQITKTFLTQRPDNILYASFDCTIDPSLIDSRISRPPFNFMFCFRLPQTTKRSQVSTTTATTTTTPPASTTSPTPPTQTHTTPSTPTTTINNNDTSDDDDSTTDITNTPSFESILKQIDDSETGTSLDPQSLKKTILSLQSHFNSSSSSTQNTPTPSSPPSLRTTHVSTLSTPSSHTTSFDPLRSPKMSSFLGSSVPSLNLITTYHGPLDFVDNQSTFDSLFNTNTPLLHVNRYSTVTAGEPIEDSSLIPQLLTKFLNECKYDIFVNICRDDYVGIGYVPDNSQAIQEICKKLNALKMQYTVGSTIKTCHPNTLFTKFLTLASSLPQNSTSWNIVLCTTYYNSLTESLQNKMREEKFIMPPLHTLTDKSSQLTALRTVKDAASIAYKNILNEELRIQQLFKQHNTNSSPHVNANVHFSSPIATSQTLPPTTQQYIHPSQQNTTFPQPTQVPSSNTSLPNNTSSTPSQTTSSPHILAFQPHSQAESTLQQYSSHSYHTNNQPKPPSSSSPSLSRQPPPTITKNNLQYPYDPTNPSNVSDFPLSFKGCLGCGNLDHFDFKSCPFRSIPGMPTQFWKNLWLHKPHTKKKSDPIPDTVRPFPIPYKPTATTQPPTSSTLPPPNSTTVTTNPSTTHGLGRGTHATQPAWMTRATTTPNPPLPPPSSSSHNATPSNTNSQNSSSSKRSRLFLMSAQIFQTSPSSSLPPMPLDVDNGLPAIAMQFGIENNSPNSLISFTCHIDSCAAMNTGNMLIHQWIMTNYPNIVAEYISYNDNTPFQPIQLLCALKGTTNPHHHTQAEIDAANSLTAIVRYKTPYYFSSTNKPCYISFGLGSNVTVNSILGLPQLKIWKADLSFEKHTLVAEHINVQFPLEYSKADSGLPSGIQFHPTQFVRPTISQANSPSFQQPSIFNTTSSPFHNQLQTQITESTTNGITRRSINWSPPSSSTNNE